MRNTHFDPLVSGATFVRDGVGSPNLNKQLKFLFPTNGFGSLNLFRL
jgi:hypothetical protein